MKRVARSLLIDPHVDDESHRELVATWIRKGRKMNEQILSWRENDEITERDLRMPESARVWIADDDEDIRSLVSSALLLDGYDVVETKDGRETMQRMRQALEAPLQLPDLIVMDVLMPHYSGLRILYELRQAQWNTPVIMMTGLPHEAVLERAMELGAIAVLTKPFRVDDLRAAVLKASRSVGHTRSTEIN